MSNLNITDLTTYKKTSEYSEYQKKILFSIQKSYLSLAYIDAVLKLGVERKQLIMLGTVFLGGIKTRAMEDGLKSSRDREHLNDSHTHTGKVKQMQI
jgi:hypothetical protein